MWPVNAINSLRSIIAYDVGLRLLSSENLRV